jgi:predicted kinase
MNTLILTVGLPRSGKSTWTKTQAAHTPIVSPDSIRLALYGRPFCWESEPMVWTLARYMVKALFLSGHETVILDACSLTEKRRMDWVCDDWTTVLHLVPTDAVTCVERAVAGGRIDLVSVIDLFDRGQQDPLNDIKAWSYV